MPAMIAASSRKATPRQLRLKRRLEALLRRHRYVQDARPDHREWDKCCSAFQSRIRLDQLNPQGWNGFQFRFTTYMRWDITPKDIEALLRFVRREFP